MSNLKKAKAKEKAEYFHYISRFVMMRMYANLDKLCKLFGTKKRQITASILCVAMILTILPVMSMTAFAVTSAPLTFTAEEDNSSVTLNYYLGTDVMYKLGNEDWVDYTKNTAILLDKNDTVSFKGIGVITNVDNHLSMTGKIAASGDVTSLTNGVGGDATLASRCYNDMFRGCTSLTVAPALPATTLADSCYNDMFWGCTSLTVAPALPATTLAEYCYNFMFAFCTGLTTAPELPATTLADYCYNYMFYGCHSLKISAIKTGDYTKEWSIPSTGTITTPSSEWNTQMFYGTGGTFTTDPEVNTVYYIYVDRTPPVISGIENGKNYCETVEFTVTDENPDTVKVNGNTVNELNGKYTLTSHGTNAIVATDKMGNETTTTINVYAEHTWDEGKKTTEPTTINKGVKTYTCSVCSKNKTEEIPMLSPSIIEGGNASYTEGGKDGLTFISNAALVDFESVSVDGNMIDKTNYTTAEGTTIVTLTTDYLATLSVGKHTLAIQSAGGAASTEFTIVAKAADPEKPGDSTKPNDTQSPQTGDTVNIVLWIALLLVSGGALSVLVISKKHKRNSVDYQ